MSIRSFAWLSRAVVVSLAGGVLVAACGGKVLLEDPQPECDEGLTACGDQCVHLNTDLLNCGQCGAACFEGTCNDGVCVAFQTCPPTTIDCSGTCVDPSSDPANCGGCGIACPSGSCSLGSCDIGECICGSLCDVVSLGSSVPQLASAPVVNLSEQWVPSCVSGSGPDAVYSFFAPADGPYVFDTSGSPPGSVLELVQPGCGSLACGGPGPGGFGAVVKTFLAAGQHVYAVVDTQGQPGEAQLFIDTVDGSCVTCADFITTGDPGAGLCPLSEQLYDSLIDCVCVAKCAMACANPCNGVGDGLPPECEKCIFDANQGCGSEYAECANDL